MCRSGSEQSGSRWRDSFVASSERTIAIKGVNLRARKVFEEGREERCGAVLSSIEQPHAGTLSQAGPHDNNKDQVESGSKMQKLVLSMP